MLRSLAQFIEKFVTQRAVWQSFANTSFLLSATDDHDTYNKYYDSCRASLDEEGCRLERAISELTCNWTIQSYEQFKAHADEWLNHAATMEKIFDTDLAKKLDDCHKYHVKNLKENIETLKQGLHLLAEIHTLFAADAKLYQHWSTLPEKIKQKTMHVIRINIHRQFLCTLKYKKIVPVNLILKNVFQHFPKWIEFIESHHEKNAYYGHLAEHFCNHIEKTTPEKLVQVIEFMFDVGAKSKSKPPNEAVSSIISYGYHVPYDDEPVTIEYHEFRYQVIRKIDQCHEEKGQRDAFDLHFLQANRKYLTIYNKYPNLYWRLRKHDIYFDYANYFDGDNIVKLLELCEFIAADAAGSLLKPIIYNRVEKTDKRIEKVIAIFSWIKSAIIKESSEQNKEILRGFADRIIALWWDNPSLADKIFAISADRYAELCEFLQKKYFFTDMDASAFKDILKKEKEQLSDDTHVAVKKLFAGNTKIEGMIEQFIAQVLALHDDEMDEEKATSLDTKLKKLPQRYLQVLNKLFEVTRNDANCLEQFFIFAKMRPFSETLMRLLERMQTVKPEKLLAKLQSFNELVAASPDLLDRLISKFKSINRLKKLKDVSPKLYLYLMSNKIEHFEKYILENIAKKRELRKKIIVLIKVENELKISLVSFFLSRFWYPKMLTATLVKAISENKPFAIHFSHAIAVISGYPASTEEAIIAYLDKMVTTKSEELFKLFEITKNYGMALSKILKAVSPDGEKTKKATEQKLYPLVMAFHDAHMDRNPEYTQHILGLLENGNDELAIKLMELHDNPRIKPHLPAIFNLIITLRIPTVKTLLEKLQQNPTQEFNSTDHDMKEAAKPTICKMASLPLGKIDSELRACMESKDAKIEDESLQRIKICLRIAKILVEHHLNPDVIDFIKTTDFYKQIAQSPLLKNHLDDTLEIIKNNPEFAERLHAIQQFNPPPIAIAIIKKMSGTDTVTLQHAKILAIAMLICPIRQSDKVGSCFIDSMLIQAASYKEGLLRILDDFMMLLTRGCVQRPDDKQIMTDYPVYFDIEAFFAEFANDNLLLRVYGYAIASLAAGDSSLKANTIKKIADLLDNPIQKVWLQAKGKDAAWSKSKKCIEKLLPEAFANAFLLVYSGHAKNTYTGTQGLWLLLDKETQQPLNNNIALQNAVIERVLNQVKAEAIKQYPQYAEQFTHYDVALKNFVRDSRFTHVLFEDYAKDEKGLVRVNFIKYRHMLDSSPYVHSGGNSNKMTERFYGCDTVIERLPYADNPLFTLEMLAKKLRRLSHEKLLLCACDNHGFNLILDAQFEKINAAATMKKMQDAAESVAKSSLNLELAKNLISMYVNNQTYPNKKIAQLHLNLLMKNVSSYHTLDDLMQAILRTDRDIMGQNRKSAGKVIEWIVRAVGHYNDKLPSLLMLADTNWEGSHRLALTCFVYDRQIHSLVTTITGEVRKDSWDHGEIWGFQIIRFPSANARLFAPVVQREVTHTLDAKDDERNAKKARVTSDMTGLMSYVGIWKPRSFVARVQPEITLDVSHQIQDLTFPSTPT